MIMFRLAILNLLLCRLMLHAADSRPNIVFLFTDDQTIGAMGCYGNTEIITPHMDKLAADGVRFGTITTRPPSVWPVERR